MSDEMTHKQFLAAQFFSPTREVAKRRPVTRRIKPETIWIAISKQGYPAPFLGYSYQRKGLTLEPGYRAVKATLVLT